MDQSFQHAIHKIIARKYTRASQKNAKIILKAYYSQSSKQKRSLTLEEMGKLPNLNSELTKQRVRQILTKFKSVVLKNEIKLLESGFNDGHSDETERRRIKNLRKSIQKIAVEIETFPKPIFAWRIQNRLIRNGLIENDTFLPLVTDLAASFSIEVSFKVEGYQGHRIVIDKCKNITEFTKDIVVHAGKAATHLGGTCSFEALTGKRWNNTRPESISLIPFQIREKYLKDLLGLDERFMLLNDEKYFGFKDRDERLSNVLSAIFNVYDNPIDKDILMSALIRSLTHRYMTERKSENREQKLRLIELSGEAFDEYCRRTLLLDEDANSTRKPGSELKELVKSYKLTGLVKSQAMMVDAIREKGRPVTSVEFGHIYRKELKLPDSHKSSCYSYPTLFFKEGEIRKNSMYKTLDELYDMVSLMNSGDGKKENDGNLIEKLKNKIYNLQQDLNDLEEYEIPIGKARKEQGLLRKYLITVSDGIEMSNGDKSCKCLICNRYFSSELLVAAHVKKRADCTNEEKADIENIAMLQCGGCDKLFENGYLFINDKGIINANTDVPLTDDVVKKLARVVGNKTEYFNNNFSRQKYIKFHKEKAIKKHIKV